MSKGSLSQYAHNVLAKKKSLKKDILVSSYLKSDSTLSLVLNTEKPVAPKPPSAPKTSNSDQSKNMVLYFIKS